MGNLDEKNQHIYFNNSKLVKLKLLSKSVIYSILLAPLIFYGWRICSRPSATEIQKTLFSGITYQRKVYSTPRPHIVNAVTIDLTKSRIRPFVSPSISGNNVAMKTSEFIRKHDLNLAINGSFFYPFTENTPWDYSPRSGDKAHTLGENISNGIRYGKATKDWNVLCFNGSNLAQIALDNHCPEGTVQGVAGQEILVKNGTSIIDYETKAYGRSAIGINKQGNKLWLFVVDGKQPFYSEGATLSELAKIAVDLGCDRAINLDGGGSTTLAVKQSGKVKLLNATIHTKIPMRERPVANHLGFKLIE